MWLSGQTTGFRLKQSMSIFDCNRFSGIFEAKILIIVSASFPSQGIIRAGEVSRDFSSLFCSSNDPFGVLLDLIGRRICCHSFFITQLWLCLVLFSELLKVVL